MFMCCLQFDKIRNRAQHNERAVVTTTDRWLARINPLLKVARYYERLSASPQTPVRLGGRT